MPWRAAGARGSSCRRGPMTADAVDRQLDGRRRLDDGARRRPARPAPAASAGCRSAAGRRAPRRRGASARPAPDRGPCSGRRSQRHQTRLPQRRLDRRRRRLAEPADRRVAHRLADLAQEGQLLVARPDRATPAASRASSSSWRTVPTRHGTHWPHDSSRKNWAIRRSVSTRSAVSSKTMITPEPSVAPAARVALEGERHVERVGPDEDARRAAEQDRPDRPAARDAAGQLDQVAQRRPELDLVDARPRDVARQAEELRAGRALGADRRRTPRRRRAGSAGR